ncbi:MAG TPA: SDR family oxidoreductase [Anaerolineae bacterium]|nr:SDR family oxidoreductase [Anaerolineae bacterium]
MLLNDKIALVTGGGRGLGQTLSLALARAGADVVLTGRSLEPLEKTKAEVEALGRRAMAVSMDIADAQSVQQGAEQILSQVGRVDILVNNAAIGGPSGPLWALDPAEWQETIDTNLTGVFLCCRVFLPAMLERKSGSIIIIGSMTGKRPLLNRTPYAASKIALVGLARTLAWETGPYGIRVNVISPGPMEGDRLKWVFETQAKEQGLTVEAARQRMANASPLNQFVSTEHVAQTAIFLASDLAGSITGEDINVSAGIAMY